MLTRRQLLQTTGQGFGALAFASLQAGETAHRSQVIAPKAKRVIQLFMGGAASHIDLFDFKPALIKHHGKESNFGEAVEAFQNGLGPWKKPVWDFKPYGRSGIMVSDLFPHVGGVIDDICVVRSMYTFNPTHTPARSLIHSGSILATRPSRSAVP